MEWNILFMGPVGAGKTQAIRTLSEISVLDTDVQATDDTSLLKDKTTVSMDVGTIHLGDGDKLRLYGAPGQDRFDFMWEILLEQAKGVVILLNHNRPDPLADLNQYSTALDKFLHHRKLPVIVAISHVDENKSLPISIYFDHLLKKPLSFSHGAVPICQVDARVADDITRVMIMMTGMLEIHDRLTA